MNYTKKVLMISMAAIMGVAMIAPSVSAEWSFLELGQGHIVTNDSQFMKASWSTKVQIPTDGSGGAFGYGVISDNSLEAVLVATSHAGVYDSEAQVDADDASFHTHYVALVDSEIDGSGICEGLEIRDITLEEPTRYIAWTTEYNKVRLISTPYQFDGTDSFTGEEISFSTSANVTDIVSFTIEPILDEDDSILAVCINDVQSIDRFTVASRN